MRSKWQNRPKSDNIFVFAIWVVGTLYLCLLMLVTAKKELELYVTTELKKRPKTTPISQVFEIDAFEHFLDVFYVLR